MSEPASQFSIEDAQAHLAQIIERAERGEEITISRAGTPVVRIIPFAPRQQRAGRGSLRGKLVLAEDWDSDRVNDSIAENFDLPQ